MSKLKAKQPGLNGPGKTKGLIFGAAGVGKTWFTLSFPAPYYIDTEEGANLMHYQKRLQDAGGVYLGPEDGALDFDTILDQMKALATESHSYKTLIIDSITKVFQATIAAEAERLGEKDAFGKSKKPAIAKMRQIVAWATRLDMNVWFVAHEASEWGLNQRTGQREEIGKAPDVWDKLVYELDLGLRVIRRGKTYPPIGIVHKSRLTGFPLSESFTLEYPEFAKRYGKDYIEADTSTISLATDEQVSEIKRLVELLKVDEDTCQKVLSKAKATSWDEMTVEHAANTITWLNAKIKGGQK